MGFFSKIQLKHFHPYVCVKNNESDFRFFFYFVTSYDLLIESKVSHWNKFSAS